MMKLSGNFMCFVVDVGSVKGKHSQTSKYFNMNKILKCPGGIFVSIYTVRLCSTAVN